MAYRLIAADMDGTLLTDEKTVTPRTAEAIRRAGERGVHFCLSTGRPPVGVESCIRQLGLTSPAICCNGAIVADTVTGEIIYEQGLEPDAALELWRFGRRFGTTMCVWQRNRLFVSEKNRRTEGYKRLSGVEPELITDFSALSRDGVTKMLWYDTAERMPELISALDAQMKTSVSYATSAPYFLEFTDSRVSKAAALEWLADRLGVSMSETVAIGDGYNDLAMLLAAGLGVAMANAPREIRDKCGLVTASNEEDGVAQAIEQLVLRG